MMRVLQQIVEVGAARSHLQPVDATIAGIVEQHDGEFGAEHDGRGDLRVQHHVAAVAHHDDHVAIGLGKLYAQTAGDFVAHGRKAVFHVIAARLLRLPQLVQLARKPPGGADERRLPAAAGALDGADDLSVGGKRGIGGGGRSLGFSKPLGLARFCPLGPGCIGLVAAETAGNAVEAGPRVGNQRLSLVLAGVERLDVEADDLQRLVFEERPGTGGEILQP